MFELPEDVQQVQSVAREFARESVLPGAQARDHAHAFPAEIVQQLAEMGFLGMFVPEQYGGVGMSTLAYVVALEEICYADASVGVTMSVNNSLVCWPILAFGNEAQKQKYLPDLASGRKLGCYALTEPNAGSDAGAQRTKATPVEGGYRLSGNKIWITNAPKAKVCVAYGNLAPDERHRGVCAFILESHWEGYGVGKAEEKLGITSSATSEMVFDNLFVPSANLLNAERKGFTVAMATLDGGRIGIAAQALGIAQRAFDLAVAHAKQREAFGKPIAANQAIQWMVADMATRIEAARLLTWRAAVYKDGADKARASHYCSMAKLAASETANFCADRALQIHGGYGYSKEYEVERLFRDARITTLYEGTSEIQRLVIARNYLG
ncbi:MAG: acyl-CoA dehydrogenase family protein [Deltaproteobacteria bacterium]|nr:acyl-CoA dehydrogenase family protein [Deltaproteobacteria bacterium]